jgi:hypothetical protein
VIDEEGNSPSLIHYSLGIVRSIDDNLRKHSSILMAVKPKVGGFKFQLARPIWTEFTHIHDHNLSRLKCCVVISLVPLDRVHHSFNNSSYISVNY